MEVEGNDVWIEGDVDADYILERNLVDKQIWNCWYPQVENNCHAASLYVHPPVSLHELKVWRPCSPYL